MKMDKPRRRTRGEWSIRVLNLSLGILLLSVLTYFVWLLFAKWNPYIITSDAVNPVSYRLMCLEKKSLFPEGYVYSGELYASQPVLIFWVWFSLTKNPMLSYQLEILCILLVQLAALAFLLRQLEVGSSMTLFGMCMYVAWLLSGANGSVLFCQMDAYADFAICAMVTLALRIIFMRNMQRASKTQKLKFYGAFGVALLISGGGGLHHHQNDDGIICSAFSGRCRAKLSGLY